jgi:hypothetical protein
MSQASLESYRATGVVVGVRLIDGNLPTSCAECTARNGTVLSLSDATAANYFDPQSEGLLLHPHCTVVLAPLTDPSQMRLPTSTAPEAPAGMMADPPVQPKPEAKADINPVCWRCGHRLAALLTRPWALKCSKMPRRQRAEVDLSAVISSKPEYRQYRRTQIAEMADWQPGFDMTDVSVSEADRKAGSPKVGDKIARNPANHEDRWLVAADYFAANFESC